MKNTTGLVVACAQMNVIPGKPDVNANYIIREIQKAADRGVDIIVFPERCVDGYMIGDLPEDDCFMEDVQHHNERICQATEESMIVAIFGTTIIDKKRHNEDGRTRKYNAAVVAQGGKQVGFAVKSLHPNYRIFDDDRQHYSTRKRRDWAAFRGDANIEKYFGIDAFLEPFSITTRLGKLQIGVILCEDLWPADYPYNPTITLVRKGAQIIFDLSASPWTWQKNRKRHQVIKGTLEQCLKETGKSVPIVYANNCGVQNNGKNLIVFDGSSTVYNAVGQRVSEVSAYTIGTKDFEFSEDAAVLPDQSQDDTKKLYDAVSFAFTQYMHTLPPDRRTIIIGASGGIDSSVMAALARACGFRVVLVNMPSRFNGPKGQKAAKDLAENLGVEYLVRPIQAIADLMAEAEGFTPGSWGYENIQARVRGNILATIAAKYGGVFTCNMNKVEAAFGYGTLYGDIAGFLAFLADLIKREVYQLGDYMNRDVVGRQVIPIESFAMAPTAELASNQRDPFDYGNLSGRGYHDELVRAFVEFRHNPEWVLEQHLAGTLEQTMMLEPGRILSFFGSVEKFVEDLEKQWKAFHGSYFKRVQAPGILMISKRAFGYDLRESMLPAHLTMRYAQLKAQLLQGGVQ